MKADSQLQVKEDVIEGLWPQVVKESNIALELLVSIKVLTDAIEVSRLQGSEITDVSSLYYDIVKSLVVLLAFCP